MMNKNTKSSENKGMQKCYVVEEWDEDVELISTGPVFKTKHSAIEWIDNQKDPFAYTFLETVLHEN